MRFSLVFWFSVTALSHDQACCYSAHSSMVVSGAVHTNCLGDHCARDISQSSSPCRQQHHTNSVCSFQGVCATSGHAHTGLHEVAARSIDSHSSSPSPPPHVFPTCPALPILPWPGAAPAPPATELPVAVSTLSSVSSQWLKGDG